MKKVRLNNGLEMPQLGIGVYALKSDEAEFAVKTALQNGYRLIDTANVYMNEKAVGRGLRASGVKREDVFISSKLWPQDYSYEKAKKAIDKTLERLEVDYIDLLLLHQQYGPYLEAWKAMEEAVKEGKVRSIGLSNFNAKRFQDVIDHAEILPVLHQIETHPFYQERDLASLAVKTNTYIESWFPLGGRENISKILNNKVLVDIAKEHNKTVAQIVIRWHLQMGYIVIPGSSNEAQIKENINVFDFELTENDMAKIQKLDGTGRFFTLSEEEQEKWFMGSTLDFDNQK